MAFARDLAKVGTFGLLGLAASNKKKKPLEPLQPVPTMISSVPLSRPTSMIGSTRGGY